MSLVGNIVQGITGNLATDLLKALARKVGNASVTRHLEQYLNPEQLHPTIRDLLAEVLAEGLNDLQDIDPDAWQRIFEHPENRIQLLAWVLEWREDTPEPDLGEWSLENAPDPEQLRGLLLRLYRLIHAKKRKHFPATFFNLLANQLATHQETLEALSRLEQRVTGLLHDQHQHVSAYTYCISRRNLRGGRYLRVR